MTKENLYKILLFITTLIWSLGYSVLKISLTLGLKPFTVTSLRFLLASLFLFLFIFLSKIKITKTEIKIGSLAGIFLGLAMGLQTLGMTTISLSNSIFLTNSYVLITPILIFLLKDFLLR